MVFLHQLLALYALGASLGVNALPKSTTSEYAVKERHPVPRQWTAVGEASKREVINLQIGLKQRNEGLVERHLLEVSDPTHARYGDHLSSDEIDAIITPADDTVDLVHEWLQEHGISKYGYSPAKDWVSIVTTIEKAEELLQTKYSKYRHNDGSTISRAAEWSLPLHLHEHIDVVQPTTSFFKPKPEVKDFGVVTPKLDKTAHSMSWWESYGKKHYGGHGHGGQGQLSCDAPVSQLCNISFTTIDCLRQLYGTCDYQAKATKKNSLGVASYLNESTNRPDILKFLQTFRPEAAGAAQSFEIININNAVDIQDPVLPPGVSNNVEADLDAELTLGIAYPTPLVSWLTGGSPPFIPDLSTPTDTNEPYLIWLSYVLNQKKLPQVISTSYGDSEQTVPYSYAKRACAGFAQLGARGISVFFSSGDSGVGSDGDCFSNTNTSEYRFLPAFPTSCPWVTSVGATEDFEPEVTVTRYGTGAGFSNYFSRPAYQARTVNEYISSLNGLYDGFYNKSGRAYPDVAAQGNRDAIVWNGTIRTVGGTSASSPTFAAVISLVNDALISKGRKPLGFLNPWLYGGAYKALTDITVGSSFGCNTSGFPAQAGWDPATGFGTPNFGKLVKAAFAKY